MALTIEVQNAPQVRRAIGRTIGALRFSRFRQLAKPYVLRGIGSNWRKNDWPEVPAWTRILRGLNPGAAPLRPTGTLFRSIGSVDRMTPRAWEYGTNLGYAVKQEKGGTHDFMPREDFIRTAQRDGHKYCRLDLGGGRWATKQVGSSGFKVKIRPRSFMRLPPEIAAKLPELWGRAAAKEWRRRG